MKRSAVNLIWLVLVAALCAPIVSAAPRAQPTPAASTPTPTDEPPKPPYVFPTPIFIPTYPGDTPIAPRSPGQPTGQDTYTVQSGDSPWTIAQKVYGDGTKYKEIMSANDITDATRLRVGTVLKIPPLGGSAPPPEAATPPASAPTQSLSTPAPTPAPLVTPTVSAKPTQTPTPSGILPGSITDAVQLAINIIAGILVLGAALAAILALLVYARIRRMEELNMRKKRLQILQ